MTFAILKFLVGSVAAICTTIAFVPQIIKVRRSGGRDLSYAMLFLYLIGVSLWLVYGLMIHAAAVIAANVAAICLVSLCVGMKWKYERMPRKHHGESSHNPHSCCEERSKNEVPGAVPQKKSGAVLDGASAD